MNFTVLDRWGNSPLRATNQVFLTLDNWNDFGFYSTFGIFYIDSNSEKHDLTGIHIGKVDQERGVSLFNKGDNFEYIGDNYFSLGSSEEYYEGLKKLDPELRLEILSSLNDIAKNKVLFEQFRNEQVYIHSFLRSLSPSTITNQFRRMADGGVKLTPYSFSFSTPPVIPNANPITLTFKVEPDSLPPTNIHVLIGRNGVGKTHLINSMIDSMRLDDKDNIEIQKGAFFFDNTTYSDEYETFANLISVSFSAFDDRDPLPENTLLANGIKYSYIGLRAPAEEENSTPLLKDTTVLPNEFYQSLQICKSRSLKERWLKAVTTLQSDTNFQQAGIIELIEFDTSRDSKAIILKSFRRLSSGHKIILLTLTKLIEKLQERSLVIMDEPEAHLHPPLLSAFIRAVSDLLISINGVGIVATHSPVILQEVPANCVWKLRRSGPLMIAERLSRESFGENVGILTNDIFGLEVTQSGFYKILNRVVLEHDYNYEEVINAFHQQLGMEARSIVMAIIASRNN